ncbi:unnamed protein product [Linum tenue]|uniref:Uncharacterized protein n=1 Tax=Linum tenue TaxID=586396 RepID=A0AAV0NNL8_9ROSI|nr:unnamed protein product [Linum tenue]
MEFSLSGNGLKTFSRCITCLARIGNELAIEASSSQVKAIIRATFSISSSSASFRCSRWRNFYFHKLTEEISQIQRACEGIVVDSLLFGSGETLKDLYQFLNGADSCSYTIQAVCAVLRTPIQSIDHLRVQLPDPDASKVQWTLECNNGKMSL